MSSSTRRDLLQGIAAAAFVGPMSATAAQTVHHAVTQQAASSGVYRPKLLTAHEFGMLQTLCELIVPGASKGHAAEFIDLLCSQNPDMAFIYTGGIAWLDHVMQRTVNATFLAARPDDQKALLDKIAYRGNATPELTAGIRFFEWVRRMTVDAYYTSAAGIAELGYMGNKASGKFEVPPQAIDYAAIDYAAIDYALKGSGTA
jgi:gluconate 2-dehydrogenase gamma chain